MEKTQNFTEGKVFVPLIRFALPVLFALFLQAMYGAVDLLIVGQFGGGNGLCAGGKCGDFHFYCQEKGASI